MGGGAGGDGCGRSAPVRVPLPPTALQGVAVQKAIQKGAKQREAGQERHQRSPASRSLPTSPVHSSAARQRASPPARKTFFPPTLAGVVEQVDHHVLAEHVDAHAADERLLRRRLLVQAWVRGAIAGRSTLTTRSHSQLDGERQERAGRRAWRGLGAGGARPPLRGAEAGQRCPACAARSSTNGVARRAWSQEELGKARTQARVPCPIPWERKGSKHRKLQSGAEHRYTQHTTQPQCGAGHTNTRKRSG